MSTIVSLSCFKGEFKLLKEGDFCSVQMRCDLSNHDYFDGLPLPLVYLFVAILMVYSVQLYSYVES